MYSVALMMALTVGGESIDRGHRGGCCGCGGYSYSCGCCSYGWGYGCGCGYAYYPGYYGGGHGAGTRYAVADSTYTPVVAQAPTVAPARIIVTLPADATLSFDGQPTSATSTERVFVSPELPAGREYNYTLRAEVMREGKPLAIEQTVAVRAGQDSRVTLTLPERAASR